MAQGRYAKHSAEFRAEAIRWRRAARSRWRRSARELGVHERHVTDGVKDDRPDDEVPVTEDERTELRRLRTQVRTLRQERDILKKAAAFFAKHSV